MDISPFVPRTGSDSTKVVVKGIEEFHVFAI